jgi:hypothetical protein
MSDFVLFPIAIAKDHWITGMYYIIYVLFPIAIAKDHWITDPSLSV